MGALTVRLPAIGTVVGARSGVTGTLGSRTGRGLVRAASRSARHDPRQREILQAYDQLLGDRVPRQVLVVCGTDPSDPADLGDTFGRAFPDAAVTVLVAAKELPEARPRRTPQVELVRARTLPRLQREFARRPAPDLLVDHGSYAAALKRGLFSHLFLQLRDGGLYLLGDLGAQPGPEQQEGGGQSLPELVAALRALDPDSATRAGAASTDDLERARALGGYAEAGSVAALTKRGTHYLKVREERVAEVLTGRRGPGWGCDLLVRSPARTFTSRATLWTNRDSEDPPLATELEVPAMTLRVYEGAVCTPRQLVLTGDVATPASFHHPQRGRLRNRGTHDVGRYFLRPTTPVTGLPVLPGTYYHLASEFPGHFGHVVTEDLSRLWGWPEARRAYPGIRLLVGTEGGAEPPAFALELLRGFGIGRDEVHAFDEPVAVERLVTATPQLHNGRYVDPALAKTWDAIAAGLVDPSLPLPPRVFVTRPPGQARRCLNGEELEQAFVAAGFCVVRPETMSMVEQVSLFAGAQVVAGYAGSGQLGAVFSRPGTPKVVISSESYYATNEWLISSVKGDRHFQLWCPSTQPRRSGGFDGRSFHADFRFDFARDGAALEHVLGAVA